MLSLNTDNLSTILCLGAHADDLEIGCGGTLLQLLKQKPDLHVHWAVFSASPERAEEARSSAEYYLQGVSNKTVQIKNFKDRYFPDQWADIKRCFEEISKATDPDLVFTHFRDDRHQDHRVLSDLAWNTFRDHLILEYEIVKWDGDLAQPNLYVPLESDTVDEKVEKLIEYFPSQTARHWFDRETFMALMRLRGVECAAPSRYAEAFHARKVTAFS